MCSVLGCGSWRRSARRYKLPEDPEKRLEWVEFLFEVNGQRLKESSWTDITICSQHFTEDCFESPTPAPAGAARLRAGAAPSLCARAEADEPAESPAQCAEPVEATDASCQCDDRNTNSPTSYSADAVTSAHNCTQSRVGTTDINKENEGKCVVNESCLLQLFHKCPSCGCKLRMEKVTCGALIILNQQCLQCEYRNPWKSQVDACVLTARGQTLTADTAVTLAPTDDNPSSTSVAEIVALSAEESDSLDEGEEGGEREVSSDREWNSSEDVVPAEELKTEDETDDEGEANGFVSPSGLKINELCTECGRFFNIQKPHVCEHKIKPYSCNICGKRCVTEMSLKNHSVSHDETYEHPCKFCHVTFKTRLDKLKHEQIHQDRDDPYRCPDCPQTFPTDGERRVHLANHRTPKEFTCGVCGIAFKDVHHLRRHSVVHTGLKPYKCSVCQRGFNQGSHLKSHMRLHTGERPYKCRHCDKSFNHNVSLKSHVQRCHSAKSGRKRKASKGASDSGDADNSGNKEGADSESESVEQGTDEEVQKARTRLSKSRRRCTGRPKGRPRRNTAGNLALPGHKEERRSNTKTAKSDKLEESEDEQSDRDVSFDSAEEEEMAKKSTARPKRRPKNAKEKAKRKRNSRQKSGAQRRT